MSPVKRWELLNEAMLHFQDYIDSKACRFSLSVIDLIHVSNFKGGNASITEPVSTLPSKLKQYELALKNIDSEFCQKRLAELDEEQVSRLKFLCNECLALTKKQETAIRGMGPSYASALLAAHFLELIPILDRRVLNGLGISVRLNSQGQVKHIEKHFSALVDGIRNMLHLTANKTLRQLDKELFSKHFIKK